MKSLQSMTECSWENMMDVENEDLVKVYISPA